MSAQAIVYDVVRAGGSSARASDDDLAGVRTEDVTKRLLEVVYLRQLSTELSDVLILLRQQPKAIEVGRCGLPTNFFNGFNQAFQ